MTTNVEQNEHEKTMAEIYKLRDETSRINARNHWYPIIAGSAGTLFILWFTKTFL